MKLLKKLMIGIDCLGILIRIAIIYPYARIRYRKKNIWLVGDRGTDARDNGYYMFRYLREKQPDLEVYFVITKDSPDRMKFSDTDHLVDFGSLKHWTMYFGASVILESFLRDTMPIRNSYFRGLARRYPRRSWAVTVFLQHGITKDDMVELYAENTCVDMFVCGALPEYIDILERYHYINGEVKYTGFPRFDSLYDLEIKRQILIMPTWRRSIKSNRSPDEVEKSSYFSHWSGLLQNARIKAMKAKYNIEFVFYPHNNMQRYMSLFRRIDSSVIIEDVATSDVQTLLKESMLLITDYSSVFFDFAYMQKPILYYQFDEEEYRSNHYAQGYFDYRRDGFGEVITEENELLDILEQYLAEECRLKPMYHQRTEQFFTLHDNRNCERVFQEIQDMNRADR